MNSLARRIEDNGIRFLGDFVENLQNISREKTAVIESVQPGILPGCLYGFFYDLHTDNLLCHRGDDLGDGSGTAVKVKDRLILDVSEEFPGCTV